MSGSGRTINLTGKRFGMLTVIRKEGRWISRSGKTDTITWLCRCDCGVEKYLRGSKLGDGSTTSCGCWRKERSKKPRTPKGHSGKKRLYNSYLNKSKKLKIPFDLTLEEFINITDSDCHYCGATPSNIIKPKGRMKESAINAMYTYNGIDRKAPLLGYVINNSLPCCASCNMAKSDMSYHEFMLLIENIYNHSVRVYTKNDLVAV